MFQPYTGKLPFVSDLQFVAIVGVSVISFLSFALTIHVAASNVVIEPLLVLVVVNIKGVDTTTSNNYSSIIIFFYIRI